MKHVAILYALSGAALALSAINYFTPEIHTTKIEPIKQATASGKLNPYDWGELEQAEVDALQKKLEAIPKLPVTIFCSNENCRNIVLDFDNAFESAKWQTDIQKPFSDAAKGIWTSSQDLADAIRDATNGRLTASILGPEWDDKTRIALAIGRKTR
ncbi:MAG: hypothetical protein CFE29_03225 [Bradyrhizobiaceae bacterium PARB1]|jgi:hypothetical protein|nr:MAG: hypothetical protein CFE29_03225 [Bradyrhizobiaceae bacterium PARB1]